MNADSEKFAAVKILIISPSFPPAAEGEAEHAAQLAERLAQRGHSIVVITNRRNDPIRPSPATVCTTASGWTWRDMPGLVWRISRVRPDAVLMIYTAWLYDQHPMATYLPRLLRVLWPGVRQSVILEVASPPDLEGWWIRLLRKALKLALGNARVNYFFGTLTSDPDALFVLGPTMLSELEKFEVSIGPRIRVVPPPPLLAVAQTTDAPSRLEARRQVGLQSDELVLAYFGYVYKGKGVETLLEAIALLCAAGRPVRLLMVGGGRDAQSQAVGQHAEFESRLFQRSQEPDLAGRVIWRQGYDGASSEPSADLMAADMAVLPFDDGAELRRSSIAVVAAAGLPLITTQPAPSETAFVHETNALLVRPLDPAALVDAVSRIADNTALRDRLRQGSLDLARDWYSWDKAIEQVERSLLGDEAGAPLAPSDRPHR